MRTRQPASASGAPRGLVSWVAGQGVPPLPDRETPFAAYLINYAAKLSVLHGRRSSFVI